MKKYFAFLSTVLGVFVFSACSDLALTKQSGVQDDVSHVRFTVDDFRWENTTKTQALKQDGGVTFIWSDSDTVGIFPDAGAQAYFPVGEGSGSGEATFDGGGWALRKGHRYSAYYPYNRYNFDKREIPLVYGTRHQTGNDNTDNLTEYDHMVSQMAVPDNGEVVFNFHHLSALVRFRLTLPSGATFTEFSLTDEQSVFPVKQSLDLSAEEPQITTSETSESLKMELSGISLSEAGEIVLYALVPEVDLTGHTLTILLKTPLPAHMYSAQITGKDFEAGRAYGYKVELSRVFIPEYVDLGLSVKWATCNVGALDPENCGGYFRWGETEPQSTDFFWTSYKFCKGEENSLTKYCYAYNYGYNHYTDKLITLEPEDDAATVNWGPSWRMPTFGEMKELMDECTWTPTSLNGVIGYEVKGSNGNSIFLPAAGYGYKNDISLYGVWGAYWSSTLDTEETKIGPYATPNVACGLRFDTDAKTIEQGNATRSSGRSVRPVCE